VVTEVLGTTARACAGHRKHAVTGEASKWALRLSRPGPKQLRWPVRRLQLRDLDAQLFVFFLKPRKFILGSTEPLNLCIVFAKLRKLLILSAQALNLLILLAQPFEFLSRGGSRVMGFMPAATDQEHHRDE